MQPASRPTKQQIRDYMQQRQASPKPPATPEEVRIQLGWAMLGNGKVEEPQR